MVGGLVAVVRREIRRVDRVAEDKVRRRPASRVRGDAVGRLPVGQVQRYGRDVAGVDGKVEDGVCERQGARRDRVVG